MKALNTIITASLILLSSANLVCADSDSVSDFDNQALYACLSPNKNLCSSACAFPECEIELARSLEKLGILFNETIIEQIRNTPAAYCLNSCNGDDSLIFEFTIDPHHVSIIESRVITVHFKFGEQYNRMAEDEIENFINSAMLSLLKQPLNQNFRIRVDCKSNNCGTACGLIDNRFQGCIFWKIQSNLLTLIIFNNACDRDIALYDFSDPNPIIKFPTLRKNRGIQSEPRQDILQRKLLMEKRQTGPSPELGPQRSLAADTYGPTPTPKLPSSGQPTRETQN